MDTSTPTFLTTGQTVLLLVTTSITSGLIGLLISKIAGWATGHTRAEVVEIRARSVKLGTEAEVLSAQEIRESTARIVQLVEINSKLQEELSEIGRQADNFEFELKRERFEYGQLQIRHELQQKFLEQLNAANKLGVQLKDLTPRMELVESHEIVPRAIGTTGDSDLEDDSVAGDGTGG